MSMGGGALRPPTERPRCPLSEHPPNPLAKPLFHPHIPGKNAKNAAPAPRFAGPAPAATT